MTFLDMTFCPSQYSADCAKRADCPRVWTDARQKRADAWARKCGMDRPLVSWLAERPVCFEADSTTESERNTEDVNR